MTVWICQCLCPQRHAVTAAFEEAEDIAEAQERVSAPLIEMVDRWIAEKTLHPWCGLCRAPRDIWIFELRPTRWSSLAEAMPEIHQLGRQQALTRLILGDLGQRPN